MLPTDLAWLENKLRPYRLIYLDSLICHRDLTEFKGKLQSGESALIKALLTILGGTNLDAARYLDEKGIGTRVKTERPLQNRLSEAVNEHWSNLSRRYPSTAEFLRQLPALSRIADQSLDKSLVIVDAMLVTKNRAPAPIRATSIFTDTVFDAGRRVECALTDHAPDLLLLQDPIVGVIVDPESYYAWNEEFTRLISLDIGWYPLVRIIGSYVTSSAGQPLINALALLVRPFPTPGDFLPTGSVANKQASFAQTFKARQQRVIELKAEFWKQNAERAKRTPPAKNLSFALERYRDDLLLIHLFVLLCCLNQINADILQRYSVETYAAFGSYVKILRNLYDFLTPQGKAMGPLPEPEQWLAAPQALHSSALTAISH